jgi:hypothetical protein
LFGLEDEGAGHLGARGRVSPFQGSDAGAAGVPWAYAHGKGLGPLRGQGEIRPRDFVLSFGRWRFRRHRTRRVR